MERILRLYYVYNHIEYYASLASYKELYEKKRKILVDSDQFI
jgi:hypothetical protein